MWALYTTPATLLDALPASMQRVFTFYVLIGSMIVWGVLFFLLFTGAHPYDKYVLPLVFVLPCGPRPTL